MFPGNRLFMSRTNAETVLKIRIDILRPIWKSYFLEKSSSPCPIPTVPRWVRESGRQERASWELHAK